MISHLKIFISVVIRMNGDFDKLTVEGFGIIISTNG